MRLITILLIVLSSAVATASDDGPFMRVAGEQLAIRRSILNVPLLILPSIVRDSSGDVPELWDFPGAVRLTATADAVLLWQDPVGTATRSHNLIPTVVAHFPIVATSTDELFVDFHRGSKELLAAPLTLTHASLSDAAATADWFTMIEQLHYVTQQGPNATWVRYTFWRAAASQLPPLADDPQDGFGYFNVPRFQLGAQEPHFVAMRWNPARPVTFYLSANTPHTYRDAIRQGVLAWNAVFPGGDFLAVADAPAGALPGDPRYPLIQWVEDQAGLGIGMAQTHPVTGEVLTGLIVIKQGWANAFATVDALRPPTATTRSLQFRSGAQIRLCDIDAFADTMGALDPEGSAALTPKERDAFRLQVLRGVIMHEVGHVLGLRHNFAGNLDATAALPSSSVMDYLPLIDTAAMDQPGAHDAASIAHLYGDPSATTADTDLLFCTDQQVGAIADCQRYDRGNDPIVTWATRLEQFITHYNEWIVQHVILPPEDLPVTPELDQEAIRTLHLIRRGMGNLGAYRSGATWPIAGEYPFERREKAQHVLTQLARPVDKDKPPFARPILIGQIRRFEQLAAQGGTTARWAQQVLENIFMMLGMIAGH